MAATRQPFKASAAVHRDRPAVPQWPTCTTAPTWAQNGMPDFVNGTDPTDRNAVSTGCGMAFISWLPSQRFGLDKIAQGMVAPGDAGTLAQLHADVSGSAASQAWPTFRTAVRQVPGGITNDDPFGAARQPARLTPLTPAMAGLAGRVFAAILADLSAGNPAHQTVTNVHAILASAPGTKVSGPAPARMCSTSSHRLLPPGKT
jgi:hypothetical protein